mmetsp:Transcript_7961/g.27356  ORF Transcript_7961/g.27356 Transcript_7961/m.27356 type:complete len:329 (+) Transcript_7961:215-1201(+)
MLADLWVCDLAQPWLPRGIGFHQDVLLGNIGALCAWPVPAADKDFVERLVPAPRKLIHAHLPDPLHVRLALEVPPGNHSSVVVPLVPNDLANVEEQAPIRWPQARLRELLQVGGFGIPKVLSHPPDGALCLGVGAEALRASQTINGPIVVVHYGIHIGLPEEHLHVVWFASQGKSQTRKLILVVRLPMEERNQVVAEPSVHLARLGTRSKMTVLREPYSGHHVCPRENLSTQKDVDKTVLANGDHEVHGGVDHSDRNTGPSPNGCVDDRQEDRVTVVHIVLSQEHTIALGDQAEDTINPTIPRVVVIEVVAPEPQTAPTFAEAIRSLL